VLGLSILPATPEQHAQASPRQQDRDHDHSDEPEETDQGVRHGHSLAQPDEMPCLGTTLADTRPRLDVGARAGRRWCRDRQREWVLIVLLLRRSEFNSYWQGMRA